MPASSTPSIVELERRLRRDPWDAATSRAWAEALSAVGDPRGELVALEHAIRSASPEEAIALATRQCALWREHEAALVLQSGGFPFRDPYLGRRVVRCYVKQRLSADWAVLLARSRLFIERFTNAVAPAFVFSYALEGSPSLLLGRPIEPETEIERELVANLLPATLHHLGDGRRYIKRDDPIAAAVDEASVFDLLRGLAPVTVRWVFSFTVPGTAALLPYQEGRIYGRPEPTLSCALQIATNGASDPRPVLVLDAHLPFDGFDEPSLDDYLTEIFATLGAALPSRGFFLLEPQPDSSLRFIAERLPIAASRVKEEGTEAE